jgi:hypothetical protein
MNKNIYKQDELNTQELHSALNPTQAEFVAFLSSIKIPEQSKVHTSPYNRLFMSMALACSVFVFVSVYSYNSPTVLLEIGAYNRAVNLEARNVEKEVMKLSGDDEILSNNPLVTEEELAMI